ncbi:MAG: deoxyribose-phosphate aldolase [Spirochaetota bacterium]
MDIAAYIDHTLLKADATKGLIDTLCDEAVAYHFYAVCVNTCWVSHCAQKLQGSGVQVAAVVGFPLGAMETESKAFEARQAAKKGANEIDMVVHIGALKGNEIDAFKEDIQAVVAATGAHVVTKVIIETALLTEEEKILACQIAKEAGADFVKTSTGFSSGGASVEDVKLMRNIVGDSMGVKASGGIKDYATAVRMIQAGATRLGTSSGIAIIEGYTSKEAY